MRSLRILVVLPMYGGSLPIGRYCAAALRKLGHSVRVFDAPELYPAYMGLRKLDISPSRMPPLESAFLRLVSQAIWSQTQEVQPDMMLALAQAPLDRNILQRMRQAGIRTVMWFVEDYNLFSYWQIFAPLYDVFAVIQEQPFLEKLAEIGQNHAIYLPLAALPDFHHPLSLDEKDKREYGADVAFLGAGYPNRRLAFRPLAHMDFKIWGSDWDDERILAGNIQRNGTRIDEDEAVKIYNASTINLNLHSSVHTDKLVSDGDFVNPRTFELAAMGAFQLVDKRGLMPELFNEDELAIFGDIDEMQKKIVFFLNHPEERQGYVERARARVLKDHTYEVRMRRLLEYIEDVCGSWQRAAEENIENPSVSPEMAKKIEVLAMKLGLAPNSAFADVVARLRQHTGPLDELETAILFLDEWRKQYL